MRERIKQVILEVAEKERVRVLQIILFGSRARGQARPDSDWDILVVVENMGRKARWAFAKKVRSILARELVDVDIIIKNKEDFAKRKKRLATISREAAEEGVIL